MRADLEYWESRQGHPLDFPEKSKSYLLYRWADALVHHPRVLDAVEDVIGPDILVYHSTMWIKEAHTPAYVRWHQDGAYFFLDPLEHVTAWVALSEASEQAGCMRVVPGTHRLPMIEHDDKPGAAQHDQARPGHQRPLRRRDRRRRCRSRPASCRCITPRWSIARRATTTTTAAWGWASASFRRTCGRSAR